MSDTFDPATVRVEARRHVEAVVAAEMTGTPYAAVGPLMAGQIELIERLLEPPPFLIATSAPNPLAAAFPAYQVLREARAAHVALFSVPPADQADEPHVVTAGDA